MFNLDQLIVNDLEVLIAVSQRSLSQVERDLLWHLKHNQDDSENRRKMSEARASILEAIELLESVD